MRKQATTYGVMDQISPCGAQYWVAWVVMFVFVRIELSNEFESFLLASARDKIQGISTQLGLDIQESDRPQWDSILKEYSDAYGVTFMLFGPNLTQLAGPRIPIPPEIEGRFGRGGGPPGGGQRGQRGQRAADGGSLPACFD
jgi:hypothetical protein